MQKVNSTQSVAKGARAKMHSNLKRQIQIPMRLLETAAGDAVKQPKKLAVKHKRNAGSCKRGPRQITIKFHNERCLGNAKLMKSSK